MTEQYGGMEFLDLRTKTNRLLPGFQTQAVWSEGASHPDCVRLIDRCTGETAVIGRPPEEAARVRTVMPGGRMCPAAEGFQTVGLAAVRHALESDAPAAVLDELGYLEGSCPEFCEAVRELFARKRVFAVLRGGMLPHFSDLPVREDVYLYDVSRQAVHRLQTMLIR